VSIFRAEPYSLEWGASVWAKVIATNVYGDSLESAPANGAVITTNPDAPVQLQEVQEQRTKSTLGLTWTPAEFTGGALIEDYSIYIAEQGGAFTELASSLTSAEYLASGLTFGVVYEFKVRSRNSYGYSEFSVSLSLLCAFKPEPPLTITTTNANELVTVAWDEPVNNGYAVHAYKFFFLQKDGVTFTEESTDCDGTNPQTVASRQCQIALATLVTAPYSLVQGDSIWVKIVAINVYGESV
jgi:hypothetical protein